MNKTAIEWTDFSWPVLDGCEKVSPGCKYCYAAQLAATRLKHTERYRGLAVMGPSGANWTGKTRLIIPELVAPLRKAKRPARVFVADMGDLFADTVTAEEIGAVWGVMTLCPHFTFQVVTKRASRVPKWLEYIERTCAAQYADQLGKVYPGSPPTAYGIHHLQRIVGRHYAADDPSYVRTTQLDRVDWQTWPLPNVHLLVSAENQEWLDARAPHLLETPAVVRGLSCEPLLGPIDITRYAQHLDWVIAGGESGTHARECRLEWIQDLRRQCVQWGVPFFLKQLGSRPTFRDRPLELLPSDRKGGQIGAYPVVTDLCLNLREFPTEKAAA